MQQGNGTTDYIESDPLFTQPKDLESDLKVRKQEHRNIPDLHKEMPAPSPQEGADRLEDIGTNMLKQTAYTKISEVVQNLKAEQLSPAASTTLKSPIDKLKSLISKGTLTCDFKAYGITWTFKTLDQADKIGLYDDADKYAANSGRVPAIELMAVAYSLEAIDGQSVYTFFPNEITLEKCENNKYLFIAAIRKAVASYLQGFPQTCISVLYNAYWDLEIDKEKALSELKNS